MSNKWLKDAIFDYIKNTKNKLDIMCIVEHFKLGFILFEVIDSLIKEGKIKRINLMAEGWNGKHYYEIC